LSQCMSLYLLPLGSKYDVCKSALFKKLTVIFVVKRLRFWQ
jgi:hypothetical protein